MNVKKKTTAEKISESEKTALYSISFEKDGTTEFENCVYIACAYRNRQSFWGIEERELNGIDDVVFEI